MSEKKFDPTKPCRTRDGRKVVIYCTDAPGDNPIHGRIEGCTMLVLWTLLGSYDYDDGEEHKYDLVNIPQKQELWLNIYPTSVMPEIVAAHKTKHEAYWQQMKGCIARIRVEFEEGEGL
jgi:hypothetical protein